MKEAYDETVIAMERKVADLRHAEETKTGAAAKVMAKKDKELEDAIAREQKTAVLLDSARQEARRMDGQHREKMEEMRRVEASLRLTIQSTAKELADH